MIRRYAPRQGLAVWAQPDGSDPEVARIAGGAEVGLLEEAEFGWARVGWGDGREGWVDGQLLVTNPPASRRSRWMIAVGAVMMLGAGAALAIMMTGDDDGNGGATTRPLADGVATSTASTRTPAGGVATSATSPEPPPDDGPTGPMGAFDIDTATIDKALTEAAATPPEDIGVPGRNVMATSLLNRDFAQSGLDLSGLEIIVYPLGVSESMVVMLSDDSTALIDNDDGFDLLVGELLASPTVAQFDIARLVLQHSTVDDEGPVVVTFAVAVSDLGEAVDAGADIFDRLAVQVERTS